MRDYPSWRGCCRRAAFVQAGGGHHSSIFTGAHLAHLPLNTQLQAACAQMLQELISSDGKVKEILQVHTHEENYYNNHTDQLGGSFLY